MSEPEPTPSPATPSSEELKLAMKAFRKRLKIMRLDDESRLGYGAMTRGGNSGITAIQPPNQFGKPVWDELVQQKKLKNVGHGLYELIDP